jgi:nucleoside-diphosphate-sugar epimerase
MDGSDIKNGDEQLLGYPRRHLDAYSTTKAMAEKLVLAANGQPFSKSTFVHTIQ